MNEFERQILRGVEDGLEGARQAVEEATWEQRREAASGLFEVIHSAWWRRHASVPARTPPIPNSERHPRPRRRRSPVRHD
jgi:hypothetical protein